MRGAVSLDSDIAKLWRNAHPPVVQDGPDDADKQEAIAPKLAAALDDAELVPDHWWRLAGTLCDGGNGNMMVETTCLFTHNLTDRPGWLLLDGQQQARLLNAGVQYLSNHQLNPASWAGQQNVSMNDA